MQAILVLGYANDSKGRLAVISRERIELALKLWKHTPQAKLIASGGFSRRFNPTRAPHYEYVMEYMRRQGVPAEALLPGLPSEYTAHEAQLAARLIQEHSLTQLTVVTSDFHLPRARYIFKDALGDFPLDFAASSPTCLKTKILSKIFALRERMYMERIAAAKKLAEKNSSKTK